MDSRVEFSGAWDVSPSEYLGQRSVAFDVSVPRSQYVVMRDGCRLAIDVYLPRQLVASEGQTTFPTIVLFTPYYRRFKLRPGSSAEPNNSVRFCNLFVPRGYAVVVVDVRGTGASFGTRDSFRSPKEREDTREIADWIVAQPWSNGRIGSTGVSYLGASADFMASTGHPAVKAIAPLFSVWDTYSDNYFPGGIQLKSLTKIYDDLMIALDHDRRDILKQFPTFNNDEYDGPQPVDEDVDGSLLREAIDEHLGNFRQVDFMAEFTFREEGLPYDGSFSSASFSPYSVSRGVRPEVAVLSVSGWQDGAGYMNGAISRFLTLKENPRHLLLGPWDHGANIDVSPWRVAEKPDFPLLSVVLRFFDTYLMELNTGLGDEVPIHYFSMHAQEWRAAASWPPIETRTTYFFAPQGLLSETRPDYGADRYKVDFSSGTGVGTRYEGIAAVDSRNNYADWQGRTSRMLSYTSAPLEQPAEIVGHALADLWLSSGEPDTALFVYLSEIEADGTERYVTEGLLRALHRKETPAPDTYRTTWPFRTFSRIDAKPMVPGQLERIRIPLLPVAWEFNVASRIRLSIAGADVDHCGQIPHGRPPLLEVAFGGATASALKLPLTLR
ncbi:CocE/NonD family hydrolase [Mesorhizobium sp. WSM3862]|uniref:CocE/NonD family hydrolase n=1 Tax=Mesorhizobium sp. WSM3862 TaxID=632858 RepID=UPI000BAF2B72|nr:CocE/NonD family hydrolase [Mesorhizobium sp. WSM3862]PBB94718.1 hydrolase [Mesorhizobium sp. WSM3862]